tara:strand:+ start:1608 stop:2435 length:828 start_codon:yes stop_codon:yes gene_type:complete
MPETEFQVTIITLVKNDIEALEKTSYSILHQDFDNFIEWIILDGSSYNNQKSNKSKLEEIIDETNSLIKLELIDMLDLEIDGIYPSMNYGLSIAKGNSIIFMNSGDIFFNNISLTTLFKEFNLLEGNKKFVFGQAQIISNNYISWKFPGDSLTSIQSWIRYFDPNHQSMLVSKSLAKKFLFDENNNIIADGIWKRKVINNASSWKYIPYTVCKFYLGGISTKRPNRNSLFRQLSNQDVSIIRKIIAILKFLIPEFLYRYQPRLQKLKSIFIDIIF